MNSPKKWLIYAISAALAFAQAAPAQTSVPRQQSQSPRSAAPRAEMSAADRQALAGYRLSLEGITKLANASKALNRLVAEDPAVRKQVDESGAKNLDDMARRIDSSPKAIAAVRSAGLTSRDYALTVLSLMGTAMAVAYKQRGMLKKLPLTTSPENIAFFEAHKTEIDKLMAQTGAPVARRGVRP